MWSESSTHLYLNIRENYDAIIPEDLAHGQELASLSRVNKQINSYLILHYIEISAVKKKMLRDHMAGRGQKELPGKNTI